MMAAGITAILESEKNAMAEGNERTPDPTILFAKLNVEADIVAEPVFFNDS